jgi:hypothetical protein
LLLFVSFAGKKKKEQFHSVGAPTWQVPKAGQHEKTNDDNIEFFIHFIIISVVPAGLLAKDFACKTLHNNVYQYDPFPQQQVSKTHFPWK